MDTVIQQAVSLSGNRKLALDDPDVIWIVARGSVEVFVEGNGGARRPLRADCPAPRYWSGCRPSRARSGMAFFG